MKTCQRSFRLVSVAFLLVAVVALLASPAFAQEFLIGPGGPLLTPTGGSGSNDIKTPPLTAGETVSIPISVHNPGLNALPNWAGVLVEVHLVDPSEVDITGVKVGGTTVANPFPAAGAGSTVAVFTWFHPAAALSGISLQPISLQPGSAFPAITLQLAAKNTDPVNNSDVDIVLRFADIYHQPGGIVQHTVINTGSSPIHFSASAGSTSVLKPVPGSTAWHWEDSHRVLVPSSIDDREGLHLDENGQQPNGDRPFPYAPPTVAFGSKYVIPRDVNPETGHFIHFPAGNLHRVTSSVSFHVLGRAGSTTVQPGSVISVLTALIPGSQIIAMPFMATANIGIEHVPEPAAPILLLCGIASLAFGFQTRRRRRQDK